MGGISTFYLLSYKTPITLIEIESTDLDSYIDHSGGGVPSAFFKNGQ